MTTGVNATPMELNMPVAFSGQPSLPTGAAEGLLLGGRVMPCRPVGLYGFAAHSISRNVMGGLSVGSCDAVCCVMAGMDAAASRRRVPALCAAAVRLRRRPLLALSLLLTRSCALLACVRADRAT